MTIAQDTHRDTTYVDAPELFDGVECNDFLQQVIPVITLNKMLLVI